VVLELLHPTESTFSLLSSCQFNDIRGEEVERDEQI